MCFLKDVLVLKVKDQFVQTSSLAVTTAHVEIQTQTSPLPVVTKAHIEVQTYVSFRVVSCEEEDEE